MKESNIDKFEKKLTDSVKENTFIKCTLSAPPKKNIGVKTIYVKLIETKPGLRLSFTYKDFPGGKHDIVKTFKTDDGISEIVNALANNEFGICNLITTENNFEIKSSEDTFKLKVTKPTTQVIPDRKHDNDKKYALDPKSLKYLEPLGITDKHGNIKRDKVAKYRQLQHIIGILDSTIEKDKLPEELTIVDMGSGKGYLTFTLYYYFNTVLNRSVKVVGVDRNKALVELSNSTAKQVGFEGLSFVDSTVEDFTIEKIDILFALHACDTATDDALFKGLTSEATLMFVAPCCQKELRPQFKSPIEEKGIFRHNAYQDRFSQMLTDSLRSLILEGQGYASKVIEFISDEHTHRNVMIIAKKVSSKPNPKKITEASNLMAKYEIKKQKLFDLVFTR